MTAARRLGIFAAAAAGCVLAVGTATADTGTGSATTTHTMQVKDDIEAWYQVLPVPLCGTPIGCPPPLPLPVPGPSTIYPEGTLHVGAALGVEISRTYLRPALYALPPGAVLTGGTATVPIDPDLKAGTINPGGAHVQACLATAPVTDGVQGGLEDPPAVNCNVSTKVATTRNGDAFTVDLAPFITAWRSGKPSYGLALLPADKLGTVGVWQVAMNGRGVPGGSHVSYSLTYTLPAADVGTAASPPPSPVPSAPPVVEAPPVVPPAVTTTQPPVAPPLLAQPQQVALVRTTGFKYSAVFLVPLAFLFALAFLGRTFTRDATPRGAASQALERRH
ncbi:MAG TPA: hypothetical protein VHE57_03025 [Mycobacteriales bacterium]|nr:hypothetical protein [Mycobacteriales bacterium]